MTFELTEETKTQSLELENQIKTYGLTLQSGISNTNIQIENKGLTISGDNAKDLIQYYNEIKPYAEEGDPEACLIISTIKETLNLLKIKIGGINS